MKKLARLFLLTLLCSLLCGGFASAAETKVMDRGNGILSVIHAVPEGKRVKVGVTRNNETVFYDMLNGSTVDVALTDGNGQYVVNVYEQISGNRYKSVYQNTVTLQLNDEKEVFLQSNQIVSWDDTSKAVKKAEQLTDTAKTESQKIQAVYNYVVQNFTYDSDKMQTLGSTPYVPDINKIYSSKTGICYDVASLMASMLRSVGVETKLVTGYSPKYAVGYHAWNEIYVEKTGKWITVDATYDLQMLQMGEKVNMIKSSKDYSDIKFVY